MSAKEPALLEVALGVTFGETAFEWGIVLVSPRFNKMEAAAIGEVTGDSGVTFRFQIDLHAAVVARRKVASQSMWTALTGLDRWSPS